MSILHTLFLPLLIPLSWIYGLMIWIRNCLYNIGLLRSISFDIPIISIGNITMGGTGKTPMVIYLARLLQRNGCKPGIVSRGYGRSSRGLIMVHDGNRLLTDVDMVGDEPYLIGKVLNTVPIIASENRIDGIQGLLDNCQVDIVILDDALQHRKVERNMDLVMISACDKPGDYHLLPWGKLREPLRNLKRVQYVIYTRTKRFQNPPLHKIINPYLKKNSTASIMQPVLMKMDDTGYHKALATDESVFAFCGIGNPNFFIQTVKDVGLNIVGKRIFKDHQKYNYKVLHNLLVQIESSNCRAVVTTEKDMVKIPESFMKKIIFYVIKIDVVFENDSDVFNLIKPILPYSP